MASLGSAVTGRKRTRRHDNVADRIARALETIAANAGKPITINITYEQTKILMEAGHALAAMSNVTVNQQLATYEEFARYPYMATMFLTMTPSLRTAYVRGNVRGGGRALPARGVASLPAGGALAAGEDGTATEGGASAAGERSAARESESPTGEGVSATGGGALAAGEGETFRGDGESFTGDGESFTGEGESSTGEGESSTGEGESSTGEGELAAVRGESGGEGGASAAGGVGQTL
ncbi:unnamed protein product [Closterium sp. Naga37s-1]|nr:unnamed protein product [Closterium sp. Naga37s-1]